MSDRQLELKYQKDPHGRQSSAQVSRDGQSGSIVYRDDKHAGRSVTGQYNENLYTSKDGHVKFDAYAGASRNIDRNRNDVNAGIKGSINW